MSIKLRLILSNLAMMIVPIILFFFVSWILAILFIGDIKEVAHFLPESHSRDKELQMDSLIYFEIKKKSVLTPEEIFHEEYLTSLENRLEKVNAGVLLRKNKEILYVSDALNKIKLNELPSFGSTTISRNLERVGDRTFAIKQHDFYNQDGAEISIFIMKDASPWNHFVWTFFPILFVLCLIILITTNGLLSFFVSKSIIKPINKLKTAAQSIKAGNLDHSIKPSRYDEIGQLTQDFEEMRVKLNESFAIQKQYEENRKELIAHISHDLKTPVTSIKGYVEGLRDGICDTPEKQDRYIQTIYAKSMDLDHLIDELFLYSKLDLGKVPFVFEKIDLKNYLIDYLEELSFDLEKENAEVSFEWKEQGQYQIEADSEKLKRVLGNIVENSLKYADKDQKKLKFSLYQAEDGVELAVEDNGPGIPEESIPYIFNQFYRAEQSRSKLTGGSGLGLSIARMIIEGHGGTIKTENVYNGGTKIIFSLPYKKQVTA